MVYGEEGKNKLTRVILKLDNKKAVARNLYLSGIAEEFIAMQLDLELFAIIQILKEQGIYKKTR